MHDDSGAVGIVGPVEPQTSLPPAWTSDEPAPRLRSDLDSLPRYRAGGRPPQPPPGTVAYSLASNESPVSPFPDVVAAVQAAATQANRYPDPASTALVAALARQYELPAEAVLIGTGSVAICQQAVTAAAGPGDEVVFAWRSFEAYPIITAVAGAAAVRVPLTPDARHDIDALIAAVTPRTRVVFVCTPNNPTGTVVLHSEVERLLAAVGSEVLVVIDEAYREYVTDPGAADGVALAKEHGNVIALRTFSKAYGLAGLRVGYGIAPPALASRLRAVSLPFGVSALAEAAAVASLGAVDQMLGAVAATIAERDRVVAELHDLGWDVGRPQGNFVWLPLADRAAEFAARCAEAYLAVRAFPGEGVRVSVAEPQANDRFIGVLGEFGTKVP